MRRGARCGAEDCLGGIEGGEFAWNGREDMIMCDACLKPKQLSTG